MKYGVTIVQMLADNEESNEHRDYLSSKHKGARWISNIVYPSQSNSAINPLLIRRQDDEGTLDVVLRLAIALFDDRTRPIHMSTSDYLSCYNSDIFQLYLGNFESLEMLQKAYVSLLEVELLVDTLEAGIIKTREDIKAYLLS